MPPTPTSVHVVVRRGQSAESILQLSPTNLAIVLAVTGVVLLSGLLWWWWMTRRKRREVLVGNIDGRSLASVGFSEKYYEKDLEPFGSSTTDVGSSGRWVPQLPRTTTSSTTIAHPEVPTPPPAYTRFFVANRGSATTAGRSPLWDVKFRVNTAPPPTVALPPTPSAATPSSVMVIEASPSTPRSPGDLPSRTHSRFITSFHIDSLTPASPQSESTSHSNSRFEAPLSSFHDLPFPLPPPSTRSRSGSSASTVTPRFPRLMTVTTDFTPTQPDELPIADGDVLRLLEEFQDGWCLVQVVGGKDPAKGVIPRFCLSERETVTGRTDRFRL